MIFHLIIYTDRITHKSFDDATTFQYKIDYANKLGLSGLMVWAIDLDDGQHTALNAISKLEHAQRPQSQFTLTDIKNLFPADYLPSQDAVANYGLVNFGASAGLGEMNPSSTGFGFMILTGDSFAVTTLRKRQGQPDPFVFLDCPDDIENRPKDEAQRARVVCLNDDVEGCFRLMERGVEGTLAEMPENVGIREVGISMTTNEISSVAQIDLLELSSCRSRKVRNLGEFVVSRCSNLTFNRSKPARLSLEAPNNFRSLRVLF